MIHTWKQQIDRNSYAHPGVLGSGRQTWHLMEMGAAPKMIYETIGKG